MKLIWQGAEIPSNKKILSDMGVTEMGVGFKGLLTRVHTPVDQLLRNFPEDVQIHAYPGIGGASMTVGEHQELAAKYEQFIAANAGRLASWLEYDSMELGPDWIRERRKEFYDQFDDQVFRPVWKHELGMSVLTTLATQYPHVVIPYAAIDAQSGITGTLRSLRAKFGTTFHVMSCSKPEELTNSPFEDVYTMAWVSPMRHGETIVWHNRQLVRYPAKMKDQARAQHRDIIEEAGLSVELVLEDKAKEVAKLAVWSLQQFEKSPFAQSNVVVLVDNSERHEPGSEVDPGSGTPTNTGIDGAAPHLRSPKRREAAEKGVLPSVGVSTVTSLIDGDDGTKVLSELPVITSSRATIRNCDTCFVSASCPAMKPGHECAFNLPVEIKTRDQLVFLLQTMIEMQSSRVAFARFAEELNGGYPDVTVSKEMDRLFKLISTMKKLEEDNSFVRMTVESRSGAGILSSIFGEKAAQALNPPDN